MLHQRLQGPQVLTVPVAEESETLAGALGRPADAHVVKLAKPEAMDRESSAADVTRYLANRVVPDLLPQPQADDAGVTALGRADHADGGFGQWLGHRPSLTRRANGALGRR
jgi:hypothetical protein